MHKNFHLYWLLLEHTFAFFDYKRKKKKKKEIRMLYNSVVKNSVIGSISKEAEPGSNKSSEVMNRTNAQME